RPDQWLDLQPGDAPAVAWHLDCTAAAVTGGVLDARGPYLQGGPGQRFIYLSWGELDDAGTFTMIRRAKLWLDGVDRATADAAVTAGRRACRGVPVGVTTGLWISAGDAGRRRATVAGWAELPAAARPDFASVNVGERGFADLVGVLCRAGIDAEAGVWSTADAD